MPFAAAVSEHPVVTHAVGEAVGQILDQVGEGPDAVVMFVTGPFAGATTDIADAVRTLLRPGALIGATAASVPTGRTEVEGRAAIALLAVRTAATGASAPRAVRLGADRSPDGWELTGIDQVAVPGATLVLLADPFSYPVEDLIAEMERTVASPGVQIIGGLASAAPGPGGNWLVADDEVTSHGAVGLLLPPDVATRTVVSQGCRPIGEALVVTKSRGNLIEEIAGQPALDRLMAQAKGASPEERMLMAQGLHLGVVADEAKSSFDRGDFLIRAVLGADPSARAIAVGGEIEVGTTVQFQVRDAAAADEDLRFHLADGAGQAALVFTCTGRGTNLFGQPHHDAEVVSDHVDGGAVAGMFCAGEVGPVGGRARLHGYTAAVLLLSDAAGL
ncbi:MAG: FIST signal transduction protein [Acidimicrobiales bacterium]